MPIPHGASGPADSTDAPERPTINSADPDEAAELAAAEVYERRSAPELRVAGAIGGGGLLLAILIADGAGLVLRNMTSGSTDAVGIAAVIVVSLLLALPAAILVAAPLRWRLRVDADGLHSRGALRTAHVPWPISRSELVVAPSRNIRGRSVAQYRPISGGPRVTLFALTRPDQTLIGRTTVADEIDALWRWASARGYVGRG